jgi:Protein of unknown function (DUF2806)
MDDDWINFHSTRARRVSDEDMQHLWARIFAEEAKKPGSFSKRTMAFVETLEKDEARLFNELCGFVIYDDLQPTPVLTIPFEEQVDGQIFNAIFTSRDINQLSLRHLDSIGLVKFTSPFVTENFRFYTALAAHLRYHDQVGRFQLPAAEKRPGYYYAKFGAVNFTPLGFELFRLAKPSAVPGYFDYCQSIWLHIGIYRIPEDWDFEKDSVLLTGGKISNKGRENPYAA